MASSTVLVCGLTGTGAELAKNVILAGVKAVTLYDPTPVTHRCLGGNPYARNEDVGKPRADCCAPRLAELNPYVTVSVMKNGSSGEAMGSLHSCDVDEWSARVPLAVDRAPSRACAVIAATARSLRAFKSPREQLCAKAPASHISLWRPWSWRRARSTRPCIAGSCMCSGGRASRRWPRRRFWYVA